MKINAEGPRTLDTVLHPARDETVHVKPQAEMLGFTPRSLGPGSYMFLLRLLSLSRDELKTINCMLFIILRNQKEHSCPS